MVGKLLCCNLRLDSYENNVWALCKRNADLRHFLPTSVLLYIYNPLIHPYLSFALWSGAKLQNTNLGKILLLQKRAPRLIYFSNNSEHAIPLFLRSNILPIDMLYYKSVGVLKHDIDHDLAPQNLKNLFTRLNLLCSRLSGCHTTLPRKEPFQNRRTNLSQIWNKIPELFESKPKQLFKKHLQTKLLQFLVHEEVYVDAYNLADKLFFISS